MNDCNVIVGLSGQFRVQLPVDIVAFSTQNGVFWQGPNTANLNIAQGDPFINIEAAGGSSDFTDGGRPDNREWHKFGHHVMADTLSNLMPFSPGDANHGGVWNNGYVNPLTTDSRAEGFAEFFSSMVARNIAGEDRPELYKLSEAANPSLESNFATWTSEEFAVAGLLWDLMDPVNADDASVMTGTNGIATTYADCVEMDFGPLWHLVQADWGDAVPKSSTAPAGYGYIFDVKHLYDVLKQQGVGSRHSRGRELSDLDELFVAHGFFADINPFNQALDPGEEVGRAAYPARPDRRRPPPIPGSYIAFDARDAESGAPFDVQNFIVEVRFAPPFEHYSYSFLVRKNPAANPGRLYFYSPDPQYQATTYITARGDRQISTAPLAVTNAFYWQQMATKPTDFFLQHTFPMKKATIRYLPLAMGGSGGRLAVAGDRPQAPARIGRACSPEEVTPTPTPTPTPTATPRPPIVESIDPASAAQGVEVRVTIYGYFFLPGASPYIGSTLLRDVEYLGPEPSPPNHWRLRATLPAGLAPGTYDVTVVNPDEKAGVLPNGFTVTQGATPTPTPTATPTPSSTATPTSTPTATPTPTATSTAAGINGRVTLNGAPAAGLRLELRFWDGVAWSTRTTVTTGADGRYSFTGAPGLGVNQLYTVRYLNTPNSPNPGPGYLWSWLGNLIASYTAGTALAGGDFDVADIPLVSPTNGASVTLPATFCWTPRGVPGDNYRLLLYYPDADQTAATDYLGYVSCVTITGLPSGWPSGATYVWWVRAYQGDDPDSTPYNFGDSYGDREVIISFTGAGSESKDGSLRLLAPGGK